MISCSHCGISDAHKEDCRFAAHVVGLEGGERTQALKDLRYNGDRVEDEPDAAVLLAEMTRVLMEMRHTWPEDDAMTVLLSEAIEAVGAVRTAYDFETEMQNVPERVRAMFLG